MSGFVTFPLAVMDGGKARRSDYSVTVNAGLVASVKDGERDPQTCDLTVGGERFHIFQSRRDAVEWITESLGVCELTA